MKTEDEDGMSVTEKIYALGILFMLSVMLWIFGSALWSAITE